MFRDDLLKGKKILITGGGTGLGKAMGRRYLELGAELVICGRREEVLAETAREHSAETGGTVSHFRCDIRDPQAVEDMMDAIWAEGPLDILVNNAAGNFLCKAEELSPNGLNAVLGIVLQGTAYCTLAAGRRWIAAGRGGNVLSIVTTYAWTGSAYVLPSAMGKAGALAMTQSLAVEWGPKGIRLNAIAPGPFPTEGAWSRLVPNQALAEEFETRPALGRPGRHEELTELAVFLVADQCGYITGECVTIDGGDWLKGAGQFSFLHKMDDADWDKMRPKKKTG
ncbi:MAG: SDR family oxidoreductase [Rhodospirillaceae bacterium]|nr:SDR family oxidoreductase [Rhodospirillaceae bacterium]MBT6118915.1 SDR family oxidoreductase [Rhodospirillaceae bacterium]